MLTNIYTITGVVSLLFFWWGLEEYAPIVESTQFDIKILFYSLLGGIIPALFWLWFWLKEDAKNPEPRFMLVLSFVAGMIAVPLVIPLQSLFYTLSNIAIQNPDYLFSSILGNESFLILIWAFIEEVAKFSVIFIVALRSTHFNEPVDALIYLITGALGFAALENMLYITTNMMHNGLMISILNLHLRFLGATVLHVVASGAIGVCIAFSFYRNKYKKRFIILGVLLATALHTLFNLFIIDTETLLDTLIVFSYYWIAVIVLIYLFEKIKKINKSGVLQVPKPY